MKNMWTFNVYVLLGIICYDYIIISIAVLGHIIKTFQTWPLQEMKLPLLIPFFSRPITPFTFLNEGVVLSLGV